MKLEFKYSNFKQSSSLLFQYLDVLVDNNNFSNVRQKQLENKAALSLLPERLESLAGMGWEERQVNLATGQYTQILQLHSILVVFDMRVGR